jgi:iron complex outermembrane receptor protein
MSLCVYPKTFVRHAVAAAMVVAALLLPSSAARAQSDSGTISGVVLDPDAKAVVDAVVMVRSEGANDFQSTTTDRSGHFSVSGLRPAAYTIEVAVPGFDLVRQTGVQLSAGRTEEVSIRLSVANITETVTVSAALPTAAVAAPSQASLTARSAQSLISNEYIRNYTAPISDYSQVLLMAPGTFSVSANGPGLGDTKTLFRGFKDGYYSMSFDGIPFNDTNDPTHHSWVFFPAQTIGSTIFDRSPGSAASIGPSTYGGSVSFLSPSIASDQRISGTASYGSFNTRLFDAEFESGRFGGNGRSRLMIEGHEMRSDGYQTYNYQKRDAFSAKYQFATDNTVLTAFSSVVDLHSNTPNQKGSTRAQIQQFGDNFLMTGDPSSALYYGYNFYHVPTNFEYFDLKANLGGGWSIDNKTYTMRYHNKQNYNGVTTITATSATDKLNSYWKVGNIVPVSYVSDRGIFRTGLWSEYASTDRYQTPSDPRTWVDAALPNFHEKFGTTTLQPYAEYQLRVAPNLTVTPGMKLAYYKQDFTQFADNGKTVGNLNGAPYVQHAVDYHSWLPSFDAHYLVRPYWSMYGQYGKGQNIPPTSIFDVQGALVATLPKPILTDTVQVGSVWKSNRATLDVDAYHIKFQNDYTSTTDPVSGDTLYFLSAKSVTKGVEAESTLLVGGGLAVYLNGTAGSAKYTDTGLWVQNAPSNTETIGVTYNQRSWNVGFFNKRVGQMYNDNSNIHQAVGIDPFNITNLFLNYTLRGSSKFSQTRVRLAVNNLTDSHSIIAVTPASTKSNLPAAGDLLTLMSGRSVSVSLTVGFTPKTP